MSTGSPTVLVVEDEQELADLYAVWLADEYETLTAYNGHEALDIIDDSVAIVLLDRRMPDLSGGDVLDQIRARNIECKVAMVTAVNPDFDIVEMGFDDYLVKPIEKAQLISLIEELTSVADYDDVIQQYFQLSAKKAALESNKTDAELEESPEYQQLVEDFEVAKTDADKMVESGENVSNFL